MTDDEALPAGWEQDDRTSALRTADEYTDYVHETGDVRVRISPPSADPESHGNGVAVTVYPYTDFSTAFDVRRVSSRARAEDVARTFMDLFCGIYERERDVEEAVQYALQRTRPAETPEDAITFDDGL